MWVRKPTSTAIPETTEGGPVDSITDILTTISQEVTTVFEEYITSTETTSLDPELGSYIDHPTTATPTMATVPIYQLSASSKPGSITESILEGLGGYASEPPMELNMREFDDQEATSGAASSSSVDYASAAIIMAGSYFVLHKLDKVLKTLYSLACFKSDHRLIAAGHRENTYGTRAWAWTATILEKSWIPLWFTSQRMRDEAVGEALDQIMQAQRIRNHGYLQREVEDLGDYLDREAEAERQEALGRQLQRER